MSSTETNPVVHAAVDGSALGNPGAMGWAWFIDDANWQAGGAKTGTNNQAELLALINLFKATAGSPARLVILCDSQYVVNILSKWLPGWKRRGWRKADGSQILNRELVSELDQVSSGRNYEIHWVKGHNGHPLNERVDQLCRAVATAYKNGEKPATGPGLQSTQLSQTERHSQPSGPKPSLEKADSSTRQEQTLAERITQLEEQVAALSAELQELRNQQQLLNKAADVQTSAATLF